MQVFIYNQQRDLTLNHEKKKIASLIELIVQRENKIYDEVSVHFVSARAMKRYHLEFFGDASLTDCISLPLDTDTTAPHTIKILGDIIVCPKAAICYAQKHKKNPWTETTLYIIHATLHLLGYDDVDSSSRALMRRKERTYLKLLEKQGLVLSVKV